MHPVFEPRWHSCRDVAGIRGPACAGGAGAAAHLGHLVGPAVLLGGEQGPALGPARQAQLGAVVARPGQHIAATHKRACGRGAGTAPWSALAGPSRLDSAYNRTGQAQVRAARPAGCKHAGHAGGSGASPSWQHARSSPSTPSLTLHAPGDGHRRGKGHQQRPVGRQLEPLELGVHCAGAGKGCVVVVVGWGAGREEGDGMGWVGGGGKGGLGHQQRWHKA